MAGASKCFCCLQGGDLRKALWQDAMDCAAVFNWRNKGQDVALAVARGLHFLHQHNVVHRCERAGDVQTSEHRIQLYQLLLWLPLLYLS